MATRQLVNALVLVAVVTLVHCTYANTPSPSATDFIGKLDGRLEELRRDCLGVDIIQNEVGNKVSSASRIDGKKVIRDLVDLLRERFDERIAALNAIKKGVEEDYAAVKASGVLKECCKLFPSSLEYHARFKSKANSKSFCEAKAKSAGNVRVLGEGIYSAMSRNLKQNQRLKWQFFGSKEGLCTIYPAAPLKECHAYDNRLRPWYTSAAYPSTKKLVIVLDTSSSMASRVELGTKRRTRLDVAKAALSTILSTLLPQDKVGVVLFNSKVTLAGSSGVDECYSTRLAPAGRFNVNYLKDFINRSRPGGGTQYQNAFKAAFTLLKSAKSGDGGGEQSFLLFLTDGGPKDDALAVERLIAQNKKEMEESRERVTIMTIGLGKDEHMKNFLGRLSKNVGSKYSQVDNEAHMYSAIHDYYSHLQAMATKATKNYILSPPYADAWGLGLMITVAVPCFSKGEFVGVAGVDVIMSDLLSEVQYFNQAGSDSFAFLAHLNTDNALSHPLLPPPETLTKDPSLVNILALEQGEAFKQFFHGTLKHIKENDIRTISLPRRRLSTPKGGLQAEGVAEHVLDYTYYCSRVLEYVLCVALPEVVTDLKITENNGDRLYYHRMDLVQEDEVCSYTDTISYKDKAVVKFSAKAFLNPPEYLDVEENPTLIEKYMNHANQGHQETMFLPGIVQTAKLSKGLVNYWIHGEHKQYLSQIPRRFFGSANGVLRFFPGEPLPRNYDHCSRHWFNKANAFKGQLTFTTPYRDPLGAGLIVTASHSIDIARGSSLSLFGVVAADLTMEFFQTMVKMYLGIRCKDITSTTCLLVDVGGYVVYHPSFAKRDVFEDESLVTAKHLTEIHGDIAEYLISNGIMTKKTCQDFVERKLQISYEIDIGDKEMVSNIEWTASKCDAFSLVRVPSTNLYVLAAFASRHSTCYESVPCACNVTCTTQTNEECECPCRKRLEYNYCLDENAESSVPICAPPSSSTFTRPSLPLDLVRLPDCFPVQCQQITTEIQCRKTFSCSWCTWDKAKELGVPYCADSNACYGGVEGRANPFFRKLIDSNGLGSKSNKTTWRGKVVEALSVAKNIITEYFPLVVATTVLLLVMFGLFLAVFCCCKKPKGYTGLEGYYDGEEGYDGEYNGEGGFEGDEAYGYEEGYDDGMKYYENRGDDDFFQLGEEF
ncbi:VWFA and cache domain-containing protein 1 [Nematostella vectensis]|uniref:VWFA and cache domain-containing protein 1 n=1 Tax=Nematostella vectensis TaxID=45351 RepID=UPI002077634E|nr:VWFA and cache domain-containing protein 1 [Nematostella vectensis]